jgi:hypothetical protein
MVSSIACLPVLTGRLIPAHGETVGNIPNATYCVPTGRFIGVLASCGIILLWHSRSHGKMASSLRKPISGIDARPHDEASRWDAIDFLRDIEPTVSPWAFIKRPVGTEGKRVVLLNVTSR